MSRILWCILLLSAADVWAGPLAQFRTVYGDIEVELFEDKPETTRNFIRYVQSGLFQDIFFHRHVPGFVIQGGGYYVGDRGTTNAGFYFVPTFPAITNEFGVGRNMSNIFGTIAMAKSPDNPNSATSQFFFNLADNASNLDYQNGGFTVFGKAVRGTNVLNRFNFPAALTNHITIADYRPFLPFDSLPTLAPNPTMDDLIYVDISLVNTQVKMASDKTREISWNSVVGRTNYVEFTLLTMPPSWTRLVATNGTGSLMKVIDSSAANTNRFYRVRVDYPANPLP